MTDDGEQTTLGTPHPMVVADAGPDQTVSDTDGLSGESATLDGSGSSDPDGTISSYSWASGGAEIATGVNPTVDLADGTHTITLTVTDDEGATDSDTVTITVQAPPSAPDRIHVYNLDDLSEKLPRGAWKAVVNAAIRDSAEGIVTGFTVTGHLQSGFVERKLHLHRRWRR